MPSRLMQGVIQVTGEHDVGKTTFALENGAKASRTLFLDDDLKGRATVQDLQGAGVKFGRYVDLVELGEKKAELDYHVAVMEMLDKIDAGVYDAIVWDTWTHFASTCHSYVLAHPSEFKKNWAPMGTIKGAQQWQEARRYEAAIVGHLAGLAQTVVLVTHLKDMYLGKVKVPGKQVPANSNALDRVLRMRIWLRLNPSGRPVPIGLLMKRLDKKTIDGEERIRTTSVLPRKITPLAGEHSLWDTIWRYWDVPFGDREPEADETPDRYELSILDGTLTSDQMVTLKSLIDAGLTGEPDEMEGGEVAMLSRVIGLHEQGRPLPVIARETGLTLVQVSNYLNQLPKEEDDET